MGETGFQLALKYFETVDLPSWFKIIGYVPNIFVRVLYFLDKELTKNLATIPNSKPKRAYYNYLIFNSEKFSSLMKRRNDFSLFENFHNYSNFRLFTSCIEYVGKGSGNRRHYHTSKAKMSNNLSGHIRLISDLWNSGGGVQSIEFENDATNNESHCREAAIIARLGLKQLHNKIKGSLHGDMSSRDTIKVSNFGELTLYLVFLKFILKPNPILRADSISVKLPRKKCNNTFMCEYCGNVLE